MDHLSKNSRSTCPDLTPFPFNLYSFILWEDKIKKAFSEEHEYFFLSDMKSDVVQLIPLLLRGYKKAVALLLRSTIENLFRHIYFFDHRVEFELFKHSGYYPKRSELCKYLQDHPEIGAVVSKMDIPSLLSSKYSELSWYVHGKAMVGNKLTNCIKNIKFEQNFYNECYNMILLFGRIFNYVLLAFHENIISRFEPTVKKFFFSRIDSDAYKCLMGKK